MHNDDVIRTRDNPAATEGGVAVLRGNLAPSGAVIKHIAADPRLLVHTGPAVVFDDYRELKTPLSAKEVRASDARMSGTSSGACVLHVAPESHPVALDVPPRRLSLDIDDAELQCRRAQWTPSAPRHERGYGASYAEHITQADAGCDFSFSRWSG
ncbi:dihydroxy-acid dehydratase [Amycolatopsis coloradensis]|nr:dihydroxy-acid dehydratase [Amycolatopsis coloradensis]